MPRYRKPLQTGPSTPHNQRAREAHPVPNKNSATQDFSTYVAEFLKLYVSLQRFKVDQSLFTLNDLHTSISFVYSFVYSTKKGLEGKPSKPL